jgi:hypothetical protein
MKKYGRLLDAFIGVGLSIVSSLSGVAAIYCYITSRKYAGPIPKIQFQPIEAVFVLRACGLFGACVTAGFFAWEKFRSSFAPKNHE